MRRKREMERQRGIKASKQRKSSKIFPDPDGDGDCIAEAEELKECSAFGETPEEGLKEIETAIDLWLKTAKNMASLYQSRKEKESKSPKNVLTSCFPSRY